MNSANPKSARRKSRELALQGVFEWLVSGSEAGAIEAFLRERYPTIKLDTEHFQAVLHGCMREAGSLDAVIQPYLDRPTRELSPVEHALLLLGTYELRFMLEVPYKVIINEAVDLAKVYGGTDGFKYVNGVLDRLAIILRPDETGDRLTPQPYQEHEGGMPANPAAKVPVSFKPRESARRKPERAPRRPAASRSAVVGQDAAAATRPASKPDDVWAQRKPAARRKPEES
uniref:Putative NusB antitermination factor n=1 Tax=mine drainage metagenome TaxID=410659 RepID=E6PLJ9_9ZZZZ